MLKKLADLSGLKMMFYESGDLEYNEDKSVEDFIVGIILGSEEK